jgi:guanylate kinase
MKKPGLVVVISSPSGAGKTTICRRLIERNDDFEFSISATTRPPRTTEKNGVDYYFMSGKEFLEAKKQGKFIETAKYLDHRYGTPAGFVSKSLTGGKIVLLDIDIQGGKTIKRKLPGAVAIFVVPPGKKELAGRLKGRSTDSLQAIKNRTRTALKELKKWRSYDYLVVNDDLDCAVNKIEMIINVERLKTERVADKKFWKKSLAKLLGLSGTRR